MWRLCLLIGFRRRRLGDWCWRWCSSDRSLNIKCLIRGCRIFNVRTHLSDGCCIALFSVITSSVVPQSRSLGLPADRSWPRRAAEAPQPAQREAGRRLPAGRHLPEAQATRQPTARRCTAVDTPQTSTENEPRRVWASGARTDGRFLRTAMIQRAPTKQITHFAHRDKRPLSTRTREDAPS